MLPELIFFLTFPVQEVMLIVGGKNVATYKEDAGYSKTATVVMSDGKQCTGNTAKSVELPKNLEGFGMASRKNRYVYVCGGSKRPLGRAGCMYFKL